MSETVNTSDTLDEVLELMQGLFDLEAKATARVDSEVYSIAEYSNEAGEPMGYIACDLGGACRLGAALTQIPAGRVDEAISDGSLPASLAENLDEVFNICVNLIKPDDGSRLVLSRSVHGMDAADFSALHDSMTARQPADFHVDIARYGVCRMMIAD